VLLLVLRYHYLTCFLRLPGIVTATQSAEPVYNDDDDDNDDIIDSYNAGQNVYSQK